MNQVRDCITIVDCLTRLIESATSEEDVSQLYGAGEAVLNFYAKSIQSMDDSVIIAGEVLVDVYLEGLSEAASKRANDLRESTASV